MSIKAGLDFGTLNSGIAIADGNQVHLLPVDPKDVLPEVVKSILYVTRDYQHFIGQEAIELYYQHNVNRIRRYEKRWAGAIRVVASEVDYMHDIFVDVDVLKPGRLLQYLKTILRKGSCAADIAGTQMFDRYYTVTDLVHAYLSELKSRAEAVLGEEITGVTLGRPVKFSNDPVLDQGAEDNLRNAALRAGFKQVDFELEPAPPDSQFIRGDADADWPMEMEDAIFILRSLYLPGHPDPPCRDAADVNDDGTILLSDAIYLLRHLYVPGAPDPPEPFPELGPDPTQDGLDCIFYPNP